MNAATLAAWATVAVIGTLFVRALPEAIRWAKREAQERERRKLAEVRREVEEIKRELRDGK